MDGEIIKATFKKTNRVRTAPQWRYNHGQTLVFENVDLPEVYEVHFSNSIDGEAKTCLGGPDGVQIPSEYFVPGCEIHAWIFVTEGDVGITKKEVIIPIESRARPTDQEPLPEERTIIDQTVSKLNEVINDIPNVIEEALTEAKESGEFDGPKGDKGDPFTYNDFTPEQLEALTGPKGDPFTFEDFTPEQLESLRGPKGDPFTYEDFTPEQLEDLQGPEGSTIWTTTHSYSKPVVDGRYYFANSHLTGPAEATKKIGDLVVMSNSTDGEYKCFSIRNFLYDGVLIDTKFVCNMQGPAGNDGVSPTVRTIAIDGGTRVIITDVNGPHWFDVMNGSGDEDSEIIYFHGHISNPVLARVSISDIDFYALRDCINAGKTPIGIISIHSRHPAKDSWDREAIDNEMEYLVMPLAEWYKDKADTVPGQGVVPQYDGVYATFVSTIQNSSYTLKLKWDLVSLRPIRNDWMWTLVPTDLATISQAKENVKYFNFADADVVDPYDDGGYAVSSTTTPAEIKTAIDNRYAVFARYNSGGEVYILQLIQEPTEIFVDDQEYLQTEFSGTFQNIIGGSVYRIVLNCDTRRFSTDIYAWRSYFTELSDGGSSIVVDDDFSSTSENPVQNKVIYNALTEASRRLTRMSDDIGNKVDKVEGKGLSANDFTNGYKDKLDSAPTEQWINDQDFAKNADLSNKLDKDQGAANANKVLKVNSSGVVVPEDTRFVVTLTPTAADYSGTMDKTPAELAAAYDAGKRIIAYAPSFSFLCEMSLATIRSNNLYTFDFIALGELGGQDIMLRLLTSDTASTYGVKTYPLSIPSASGVSF